VELRLREQKIKDLSSDKVKLKQLLRKAKDAIDSLSGKYKQSQEAGKLCELRLREALERNSDLTATMEIFQRQLTGVEDPTIVRRVLARVRVDQVAYTLLELARGSATSETLWYRDS
jgi:chromosome segregation ATPase